MTDADQNGTSEPYAVIAVAGSGAIATGLASLASCHAEKVWLLARSTESARRASESIGASCERIQGADADRVTATTDPGDLAGAELVVEAIVEDLEVKAGHLREIGGQAPQADLATTTSSLSIGELGRAAGLDHRLFGLHVFNPVPVMNLVELCLPDGLDEGIGERAKKWCAGIGKTAVVVPDTPGFVVNRLLFPYLFDAVRFRERTGMSPEGVDTCMTLGVAHPMGPLALLDLIGLDVATEIGKALHADSGNDEHLAPASIADLVAAGHLGQKSGRGFYDYD
ncbi:MAG: 3-hydroxyacyl-CoA dehydrogenase family protein [Solirubrobacterales bacterium]|nr:3-hydroxyacyl-CoA dehydrogenase family protein [Solirubrobacterales bacterium]